MSIEYLNNKIFEELIARYKKTHKYRRSRPAPFKDAEKRLAEAFSILSDNIIRAFKFQLIDQDDMMQEGVLICLEKLHCFNPDYVTASGQRSRAFNYFTTCILNHYRQMYRTAKNYKQLQERYYDFMNTRNQDRIFSIMLDCINNNQEED